MTAFHVDAAPVSRRFEWTGSAKLERLGVEADMTKVGVPVEGIARLLTVVRDNLDCLNTIRADLFARGGPPLGGAPDRDTSPLHLRINSGRSSRCQA